MLGLTKGPPSSRKTSALIAVQRGNALLADQGARLTSIRSIIGVPEQHWRLLYQSLFTAFAEYVQRLPASETHHHCEAGGLLRHALEVVELALKIRRGYLLPPGKEPEVVANEQDVWTYAVATAALLHDVGKPLLEQDVTLHGRDGLPLGLWSPWVGPITGTGSTHYRIDFRRGHACRLHAAVAPLLVGHVVPKDGLRWLGCHDDALAAWLSAISGHTAGVAVIADIVREADERSVAQDLSGERWQLPSARARPLAERLLVALRQLIENGALPINQAGAAAFIDDNSLWLVSKRCLDAVRESMGGQSGPRIDRLMEELQQRGIALPAPDDRAEWNCEVRVATSAETWCQTLTLLRIPVDCVWQDPATRPKSAEVRVRPLDGAGSEALRDVTPAETRTVPAQAAEAPLAEALGTEDRVVDANDAEASRPELPSTACAVDAHRDDPGRAFVQWLIDGLRSGGLPLNTAKAHVHVVDEGLLLVSPAVFRSFAGDDWLNAQKRFLKRKLTDKTAGGENIFRYRLERDRGQRTIKGMLIRNAEKKLGVSLPSVNPLLSLKPDVE